MNVLSLVELVVGLLALCVAVSLVSLRLHVPYTLALVIAGFGIGLAHLLPGIGVQPDLILFFFLPALLFEGAWSLDLRMLAANWMPIFLFAVPGLLLSVLLVGGVLHLALGLSWLLALLLGAMLSPTDPVAVLALFRQLRMPARLRVIVEGESLFNDGVGAAAFEIVLGLLLAKLGLPPHDFGLDVTRNVALVILGALWLIFGGLGLGLLAAWLIDRLLALVDNFLFETALTFTVAYGIYLIAALLHTSGILAVIGAGLLLGNAGEGSIGRRGHVGMSQATYDAASKVWEFTGYLANSFLFLLLGLQLSVARFLPALPAITWAVIAVVGGRAAMIWLALHLHSALVRWLTAPLPPVSRKKGEEATPVRLEQPPRWIRRIRARWPNTPSVVPVVWRPLLLFSGLRGALSIVLVLSLPAVLPQLPLLETIVYGVVLVTLVGQGVLLRLVLPIWPQAPAPLVHTSRDNTSRDNTSRDNTPPVAPIPD